jgi:TIR domain/Polyketide cyclase / dehydrase and lipid transport
MTAAVFLSYRRGSASGSTGRLYDAMIARLGESSVFMDIDNIQPGDDFVEVLDRTLAACRAVVVVIDREWLDVRDRQGRRRLDNPRDFVRLEVENALRHGLRVIPVLVDEADMPAPEELPPSIRLLANRHAVEISATRFHYDAGRLIDAVERTIRGGGPPGRPPAAPQRPVVDAAPTSTAPQRPTPDPPPPAPPGLKFFYDVSSRPIAASAQVVWDLLVDVSRYPEHVPWVVKVELLTSGPAQQGYRYRAVHRMLRLVRLTYVHEFTEFAPRQRLTVTDTQVGQGADKITSTSLYLLASTGATTTVRLVEYADIAWKVDGMLSSSIVRRWLRRLAELAEAEQARRA